MQNKVENPSRYIQKKHISSSATSTIQYNWAYFSSMMFSKLYVLVLKKKKLLLLL